jgi:NTP pyrophosphatase (non-canonical NTP hydrolase)
MTISDSAAARVELARRVREADERRTNDETDPEVVKLAEESASVGTIASFTIGQDGAMDRAAKDAVIWGFTALAQSVSNTAHAHGWWETDRNFGEMIALMHSELSEALEAWRDGDDITEVGYEQAYYVNLDSGESGNMTGKPVGVASEFADVIIRILDTCQTLNIPVIQALIEKAEYNISRPYRHGGKLA